jgi:predicted DNA-binding transcriptional regulator YafY
MAQNERIFYIDRKIRRHGHVKVKEISNEFGISERQAKRDIESMRDRLSAPILYSREKGGYFYESPFEALSFADERTLLFYAFLEKIAENRNYLPFVSQEVLSEIKKLLYSEYKPLLSHITYELEEWEYLDIELFRVFIDGMLEKKIISFSYRDSKGRESRRFIEPLHFIHYGGKWYSVGYDIEKSSLRTFHFGRISSAVITEKPITGSTKEKDLAEYLAGSFGIFKGEKTFDVKIRFYGNAYHIVRSQTWHPRQKTSEGKHNIHGDFIELTLPVSSFAEILGKVLRYGADAEAVSPAEFREAWLDAIREMSGKWCLTP